MPCATMLTDAECLEAWEVGEIPDRRSETLPYEDKAGDWGRLRDGRLVVVHYGFAVVATDLDEMSQA